MTDLENQYRYKGRITQDIPKMEAAHTRLRIGVDRININFPPNIATEIFDPLIDIDDMGFATDRRVLKVIEKIGRHPYVRSNVEGQTQNADLADDNEKVMQLARIALLFGTK